MNTFILNICHASQNLRFVSFLFVLVVVFSGCTSAPKRITNKVDPYRPTNFQVSRSHLKAEIVRVAVLNPEIDRELGLNYGVQLGLLQEVFKSEVIKPRLFEVVMVDSNILRSLIGPTKLSSNAPYPIGLLARSRKT